MTEWKYSESGSIDASPLLVGLFIMGSYENGQKIGQMTDRVEVSVVLFGGKIHPLIFILVATIGFYLTPSAAFERNQTLPHFCFSNEFLYPTDGNGSFLKFHLNPAKPRLNSSLLSDSKLL